MKCCDIYPHLNTAGFFNQEQTAEMMKEAMKMSGLDHPHVLTLIGVCVDGGPSLYIVMPFMANGSLLSYLKADRKSLLMPEDAQDEAVHFSLTPPLILKSMIVYICLK